MSVGLTFLYSVAVLRAVHNVLVDDQPRETDGVDVKKPIILAIDGDNISINLGDSIDPILFVKDISTTRSNRELPWKV